VFVQALGWEVPGVARDGVHEEDQFDSEECVYVIAVASNGICGCARLLPTTRPYVLEQMFPSLVQGARQQRSDRVWEMSRLAASAERGGGRASRSLRLQVFAAALGAGRSLGATQIIGVVSQSVLRMLERSGVALERLSSMRVQGALIVACSVELKAGPA